MASIIVAVACNLVMALILVSGILTSLKCGWRVALTKFVLVLGGAVGTYFLAPYLSGKVLGLTYEEVALVDVLANFHISAATVKSLIFFLCFLVFYVFALIVCKIMKHCLIRRMRKQANTNRAKIKRAKSINPKAERLARRTAWREMKAAYYSTNNFWKRLLSLVLHLVVSAAMGFVVLLPYGYIAKDINHAGTKDYLVSGYKYTLNGVIGDELCDKLLKIEKEDAELPETPEDEEPVEPVAPEEPATPVEPETPEVSE